MDFKSQLAVVAERLNSNPLVPKTCSKCVVSLPIPSKNPSYVCFHSFGPNEKGIVTQCYERRCEKCNEKGGFCFGKSRHSELGSNNCKVAGHMHRWGGRLGPVKVDPDTQEWFYIAHD